MGERIEWIAAKAGFRGLGLSAFAAVCFAYGSGLELGYRPTFVEALGLHIPVFGWMFIGLGFFSLTGVLAKRDKWHFAFCELCVWAWVILIATHWTAPYGWGASVSWMGVAGALLIASAWPEPPHKRQVTELEQQLNGKLDHDQPEQMSVSEGPQ
jgi:hypothetical protein